MPTEQKYINKNSLYLIIFYIILTILTLILIIFTYNKEKNNIYYFQEINEPKLSDFNPYKCMTGSQLSSCKKPIKVSASCVDVKKIKTTRPFTEVEKNNYSSFCKLLPIWLELDPRIKIVDNVEESEIQMEFKVLPYKNYWRCHHSALGNA